MTCLVVCEFPEGVDVKRFCLDAVHRKSISRSETCEFQSLQLSLGRIPVKGHRDILIGHLVFVGNEMEFHIVHTRFRKFKVDEESFKS